MIPLHSLWTKSNNRTHRQFECDVPFVLILFVHLHGAVVVPQFVGEGRGAEIRLKLDVQAQGGATILDVDGQGKGVGLEN